VKRINLVKLDHTWTPLYGLANIFFFFFSIDKLAKKNTHKGKLLLPFLINDCETLKKIGIVTGIERHLRREKKILNT
jgi:hypothetical protein